MEVAQQSANRPATAATVSRSHHSEFQRGRSEHFMKTEKRENGGCDTFRPLIWQPWPIRRHNCASSGLMHATSKACFLPLNPKSRRVAQFELWQVSTLYKNIHCVDIGDPRTLPQNPRLKFLPGADELMAWPSIHPRPSRCTSRQAHLPIGLRFLHRKQQGASPFLIPLRLARSSCRGRCGGGPQLSPPANAERSPFWSCSQRPWWTGSPDLQISRLMPAPVQMQSRVWTHKGIQGSGSR